MATIQLPYSFINGLPIDASQLNANFQALAGGVGSNLALEDLTNVTSGAPVITGGSIDGAPIGQNDPKAGKFTILASTASADFSAGTMKVPSSVSTSGGTVNFPPSGTVTIPPPVTPETSATLAFNDLSNVQASALASLPGPSVPDYVALRAYTGSSKIVYVYGAATYANAPGKTFGWFYLDGSDTTSADNGGTVIVDSTNRRWKRWYDGRTLNVQWFGAVGTALADDTSAIQATINAAQLLVSTANNATGAIVYVPEGQYYVSATLTVSSSFVKLVGDGKKVSRFVRNTSYSHTLQFNSGAFMEECGVEDLGFVHDVTVGNAMTGAHIMANGVTNLNIRRNHIDSGAYGIILYGCVYPRIEDNWLSGNYQPGVAAYNSTVAILLQKCTIPGIPVAYPTIAHIHRNTIVGGNGVYSYTTYPNWRYGILVNCAEEIHITDNTIIGMNLFNVYIQQTDSNDILLDIFVQNNFLDSAGANALRVTGANGDGSQYIGKITFTGNQCNGEGQADLAAVGGSGDAIYIDGTARAGTYAQACLDLMIADNIIDNWYGNGINVQGCINASLDNNVCRTNNFNNSKNASGIVVGPNVQQITINGGASGGTNGPGAGNTLYGLTLANGAKKVLVNGVDVRLNATGGVQNNMAVPTTAPADYWIVNCPGFNGNRPATSPTVPASGVDQYNPLGSRAWVSLFGGTVSKVSVNGQDVFFTTGVQFPLGPGDRVTLTYTVAPSWIWWAE